MREPDPQQRPLRLLVSAGRYREALALFLGGEDPAPRRGPGSQLLAAQAAARVGEFAVARRLAGGARELFRAEGEHGEVLEATNLLGAVAFERRAHSGRVSDRELVPGHGHCARQEAGQIRAKLAPRAEHQGLQGRLASR